MPEFTIGPPPKFPPPPPVPPGCREVTPSADQCSTIDDLCESSLTGPAVFGIFTAAVFSVAVIYILYTAVDGTRKGKSCSELPRHTVDFTRDLYQRSITSVHHLQTRLTTFANQHLRPENTQEPDLEMEQSEPLRNKAH